MQELFVVCCLYFLTNNQVGGRRSVRQRAANYLAAPPSPCHPYKDVGFGSTLCECSRFEANPELTPVLSAIAGAIT